MGNKALRALAAGLGSIGQSLSKMDEQDRADAEKAAAQKRDDDIRAENRRRADRQYDLQKTQAETANRLAQQQQMLNEITLSTQKIVGSYVTSEGDPTVTFNAINQYGNVDNKLRFDGYDEKGNVLFTTGTWQKNADGTYKKGADGQNLFFPNKDKDGNEIPSTITTRGGVADMVSTVTKGDNAIALYTYRKKKEMGLEFDEKSGKSENIAADTEYKRALAEKARRTDSGQVKKDTEFKGIDGNVTALTTAKINSLRDDAKGFTEHFNTAVSAPQAHRLNQMSESDAAKKDVRNIAGLVAEEKFSRERAARALVDEYDIPVGVAERMIDKEVEAIETNKPGWWDNFLNTKKAQRAKQ